MRRVLLCLVTLSAVGCDAAPDGAHGVSAAMPASLAGEWRAELTVGRLPWTRESTSGLVRLEPDSTGNCPDEPEDAPDSPICETLTSGTYSIPLASIVDPHVYAGWTAEAGAVVLRDGAVLISIGGCCDRGEIVGSGRMVGDRIEGKWHQQFLGGGPSGKFVLRRASTAGLRPR